LLEEPAVRQFELPHEVLRPLPALDVAAEQNHGAIVETIAQRGHLVGKFVLRLLAGAGITDDGKLEGAGIVWQLRSGARVSLRGRVAEGKRNQDRRRGR